MESGFFSRWMSLTMIDPWSRRAYTFGLSGWWSKLVGCYGYARTAKIVIGAVVYTAGRRTSLLVTGALKAIRR
jgi:hypothetical protein